jgi:hypothetical protein
MTGLTLRVSDTVLFFTLVRPEPLHKKDPALLPGLRRKHI